MALGLSMSDLGQPSLPLFLFICTLIAELSAGSLNYYRGDGALRSLWSWSSWSIRFSGFYIKACNHVRRIPEGAIR